MANMGESSDALIEIQVRTMDSQIHCLSISNQRRVRNLKEDIALLIGTPIEQQRLIYCGIVLEDDQVISSYNVHHGDTLHLVSTDPGISSNDSSSSHPGASHSQGILIDSNGASQDIQQLYDLYLDGLQENDLVPTSSVFNDDDLPEYVFPNMQASADIRQQNNTELTDVHGEENNRNSVNPSQDDFIPDGETATPRGTTENVTENMGTGVSSGPSTVEYRSESSIEPSDENNLDFSSTR